MAEVELASPWDPGIFLYFLVVEWNCASVDEECTMVSGGDGGDELLV